MHAGLHARMPILVEMRLVRLLRGFDQRGVLPHECRCDGMRPGRHVQANLEPLVHVFVGVVLTQPIPARRNRELLHARAVEQNLQLVRLGQPLDVLVPVARKLHLNLVLAVERERMREENPAARPERQSLDVLLLREIGRKDDDAAGGCPEGAADRHARDLLRGGEVALHQSGRQTADAHVVEAVARLVDRQQLGDIHVQRQDVADGVAVLGAVQAADRIDAPWRRIERGGAVQRRFERCNQPVERRVVGARRTSRRHGARSKLADDMFPEPGVAGRVHRIRSIERDAAGLRPLIVAADAILRDELAFGRGRRGRLGRGPDRGDVSTGQHAYR